MDKNTFWKLKESLKPNEALMIFADNTIKKYWKDDRPHKLFLGVLEEFPEEYVKLPNKPFARPKQKGKKSFYKFGQILPKFTRRDKNSSKIEKWTKLFNVLKALDFEPEISVWVDTYMRLRYDVHELGGVKIYYFRDTPRYVEYKGEKLDIYQTRPDLKTTTFDSIDDVK